MYKQVDGLGRIVIPIGLRRKYELTESSFVSFHEEGGVISITPIHIMCKLCYKKLENKKQIPLCDECIEKIKAET